MSRIARNRVHDVPRPGDLRSMAIVVPGGWRVTPIVVERGGQRLQQFRVTRGGRFICECASPKRLVDEAHSAADR